MSFAGKPKLLLTCLTAEGFPGLAVPQGRRCLLPANPYELRGVHG